MGYCWQIEDVPLDGQQVFNELLTEGWEPFATGHGGHTLLLRRLGCWKCAECGKEAAGFLPEHTYWDPYAGELNGANVPCPGGGTQAVFVAVEPGKEK